MHCGSHCREKFAGHRLYLQVAHIHLLHLQLNIGVTLGFVVLPPFKLSMSLLLCRKEQSIV